MPLRQIQPSRSACLHPERAPQPATLRAVARAWAEARSGFLRVGRERIQLLHGEPADRRQLQLVVDAMYQAEAPRFVASPLPASPVPPALPGELWTAASRLADRSTLRGRGGDTLVPGPLFRRLSAFPASSQTRLLLTRAERTRVRLGDTERLDQALRMTVLDELCALIALDVVRLERSVAQAPVAEPARPQVRVDASTLRRLVREAELLADADDWTVLGCNRRMDPARVAQGAERMVARYRALVDHPRVTGPARRAAARILERVELAASRVAQGEALGGGLTPEMAIETGCAHLERGEVPQAVKCFALAQSAQVGSSQATAWLGYAVFHDPTRPVLQRQSTGRRMLDKAIGPGAHADAHYLMARLRYEEGELVRAWNHADAALRADPSHRLAGELSGTIQRQIRQV